MTINNHITWPDSWQLRQHSQSQPRFLFLSTAPPASLHRPRLGVPLSLQQQHLSTKIKQNKQNKQTHIEFPEPEYYLPQLPPSSLPALLALSELPPTTTMRAGWATVPVAAAGDAVSEPKVTEPAPPAEPTLPAQNDATPDGPHTQACAA